MSNAPIQNNIMQLLINYKIEKISLLSKIDEINKTLNLLKEENLNKSKENLISMYLSSEFEDMKETTQKKLSLQIEKKLQNEISKIKKQNTLLAISFLISISALSLSLIMLLK